MRPARPLALAFALAVGVHAQTWPLDGGFAPVLVNDASALLNTRFAPANNGQFFALGSFTHVNGAAVAGAARLGADGKPDGTFAPDLASNEYVSAIAPLPDNRAVAIIGSNTPVPVTPTPSPTPVATVAIVPSDPGAASGTTTNTAVVIVIPPATLTTKLVRLRADGRKDAAFSPLALDGNAQLTATADGRIIVWGSFRNLGGQARSGLARLNTDGALDATFTPSPASAPVNITNLATASDGSMVLSGFSYDASGRAKYIFARLLASGAIDTRFAPTGVGTTFSLLALQPDGAVLAGTGSLLRYTSTGALDRSYSVQIPSLVSISRLAALSDGRLAVEANVYPPSTSIVAAGVSAPTVFTLTASGQIERDLRKVPGAAEGARLLAAAADGRLLVVQGTLVLNPTTYYPFPWDVAMPAATTSLVPIFLGASLVDPVLALTAADASSITTLSTTIVARSNGSVNRLHTDAAGRVLASGSFTQVDGQPRAGLARFLPGGALDPAFVPASGSLLFMPVDGRAILSRTTVGPLAADGFHRYVTQTVRLQADGSIDPAFALPAGLNATNWLASTADGRLLVAAFDPDDSREENLKLIWLGSDGRRLTTLPTAFTGFTRVIVVPLYTAWTTSTSPAAGNAAATATTVSVTTTAGTVQIPAPIDAVTVTVVPSEITAPAPPGSSSGIPPTTTIALRPNPLDSAQPLANGQLLVAGGFKQVNNVARPGLVRLQADGSVDASYAPDLSPLPYPDRALLMTDGAAYVFGSGPTNGRWSARTVRLRTDGTVDAAFQPPADTFGSGARPLGDGSIVFAGRRFTADGWPDLNFAPRLRGYAFDAALSADGRLWLGGGFDRVGDQPRASLARFVPTEVVGITVPPKSQSVVAGRDAFFQVGLGTRQPATFRWTHDGAAVAGATGAGLRLARVSAADAGVYRAIATIGAQTFTSDPATLTVVPNRARLINFSALSFVAPGAPPQIAGIVCAGAARQVLLRAVGLGLPGGLGRSGLALPVLSLFNGATMLAEDRGGASTAPATALAAKVGAFPMNSPVAPGVLNGVYGSALTPTLGAGAFTAMTSSGNAGSGVSLFECYDTGDDSSAPLIRNLAIRGQTSPGNVLTAGFVVAGNGPVRVLVRALGPALAGYGVNGAIADPGLAVFGGYSSRSIANNSGWAGDAEIAAAARNTGAFALAPGSRDAALLLTLEAGAYTAQLASASGVTGAAMIEIYVVENGP